MEAQHAKALVEREYQARVEATRLRLAEERKGMIYLGGPEHGQSYGNVKVNKWFSKK